MSAAIRVGTRGSALSRVQTELALDALHAAGLETETVIIRTEGDRDRTTSLRVLGGRGVFVRAIETALLNGEIDLAVHSAKDIPSTLQNNTALAAFLPRADVRDALVTPAERGWSGVDDLPLGAQIGTGSRRRAAQLRTRRPDLEIADIRGNVDTRIRKLLAGEFDAILLAVAGLARLGQPPETTVVPLAIDLMLPAPGQGALALQTRAGDEALLAVLRAVSHQPTELAVRAERATLAQLGAGCTLPVAALGHTRLDEVVVAGRMLSLDGTHRVELQRSGPSDDPEAVGIELGQTLLDRGGRALLEQSP